MEEINFSKRRTKRTPLLKDVKNSPTGIKGKTKLGNGSKVSKEESAGKSTPRSAVSLSNTCQTPREQRHRMQLRLRKILSTEENDLDSESSSSSSSSDEETNINDEKLPKNNPIEKVVDNGIEEYFNLHGKRSLTSDKNLSNLRQELLEMNLDDLILKYESKHQPQIQSLLQDYKKSFKKWSLMLKNDFNLLFYGLGSKKTVLEEFRTHLMEDFTVLDVKGYLPMLNINMILKNVFEIFNSKCNFRKLEKETHLIKKYLEGSANEELCILIHNIDGPGIRNEKAQSVICALSQCPRIHIVASIDHHRSPLMWDTTKLSRLNWIWEDVTTFLPYTEETDQDNSILVKQAGSLALNSALYVFRSLTPNGRKIFILLAKNQLEKMKTVKNFLGMPFEECYLQCRSEYLINSQLTLNSQLIEFKDHKLLKIKKGSDGGDYLFISLDSSTLTAFLKSQSENLLIPG